MQMQSMVFTRTTSIEFCPCKNKQMQQDGATMTTSSPMTGVLSVVDNCSCWPIKKNNTRAEKWVRVPSCWVSSTFTTCRTTCSGTTCKIAYWQFPPSFLCFSSCWVPFFFVFLCPCVRCVFVVQHASSLFESVFSSVVLLLFLLKSSLKVGSIPLLTYRNVKRNSDRGQKQSREG